MAAAATAAAAAVAVAAAMIRCMRTLGDVEERAALRNVIEARSRVVHTCRKLHKRCGERVSFFYRARAPRLLEAIIRLPRAHSPAHQPARSLERAFKTRTCSRSRMNAARKLRPHNAMCALINLLRARALVAAAAIAAAAA